MLDSQQIYIFYLKEKYGFTDELSKWVYNFYTTLNCDQNLTKDTIERLMEGLLEVLVDFKHSTWRDGYSQGSNDT